MKLVTREDCGTVSWGTLVSEDLLDAFTSTLEYLWPEKAAAIRAEYKWVYARVRENVGYGMRWKEFKLKSNQDKFNDDVSWLINEALFNVLNDCCDDGVWFGASEGDGADFGFWYYEDEYEHDEDEDTIDESEMTEEEQDKWLEEYQQHRDNMPEDTGNDDYDGTGNPFRK